MKNHLPFFVLMSLSAFAAAGQLVDASAFNNAVTVSSIETFAGVAAPGSFTSLDGGTTNGISYSGGYAYAVDPAYSPNYYDWGTGAVGLLNRNGPETLTFANPVTAFSAEFGSILNYAQAITVTIGSDVFTLPTNNYPTLAFFGYTSDTPFTSVSIQGANSAYPIIDNITLGTANVPEPAPLALLGLGLVGFIAARRKSAKQ